MNFRFWKRRPTNRRDTLAKQQVQSDLKKSENLFRRSRTIAGSGLSFSADSTERSQANQLIKQRRKLSSILVSLILGCAIIALLLTQLIININVLTPSAKSSSQVDLYEKVANEYFSNHPLERLLFALDYDSLNKYFLEHAPEVQSVRFESGGLTSTTMKLIFRQPVIKWSTGGQEYFVDSNGVTFNRNYFDDPKIAVDDQSGIPTSAGQEVLNKPFMSFIGQSIAKIKDKGYTVTGVILPVDTVRQVTFSLEGQRPVLRMTLDRGVDAQVGQAMRAIEYFNANGASPEYIDVRVDQRVFYK